VTDPSQPPIEEADVADVAAALPADADAVLVDVREDFEWRKGHAEGARHIPLRQLPDHLDELPRNAPLYLICATGHRSANAARYLKQAGFERPINVRGGTVAWQRAGLPIAR
jgi:rhodanese-related sulfurtransferase